MRNETRFRVVEMQDPDRFRDLLKEARRESAARYALYEQLARLAVSAPPEQIAASGDGETCGGEGR